MIPFMFCKWLQDVFDVPIVIQMTGKGTLRMPVASALADALGKRRREVFV